MITSAATRSPGSAVAHEDHAAVRRRVRRTPRRPRAPRARARRVAIRRTFAHRRPRRGTAQAAAASPAGEERVEALAVERVGVHRVGVDLHVARVARHLDPVLGRRRRRRRASAARARPPRWSRRGRCARCRGRRRRRRRRSRGRGSSRGGARGAAPWPTCPTSRTTPGRAGTGCRPPSSEARRRAVVVATTKCFTPTRYAAQLARRAGALGDDARSGAAPRPRTSASSRASSASSSSSVSSIGAGLRGRRRAVKGSVLAERQPAERPPAQHERRRPTRSPSMRATLGSWNAPSTSPRPKAAGRKTERMPWRAIAAGRPTRWPASTRAPSCTTKNTPEENCRNRTNGVAIAAAAWPGLRERREGDAE